MATYKVVELTHKRDGRTFETGLTLAAARKFACTPAINRNWLIINEETGKEKDFIATKTFLKYDKVE